MDFLNYAFDHVQTGLALMDERGVLERVNKAGAAMVGIAPERIVGRALPDLVHPDDVEETLLELEHLLMEGHGGPIQVRVARPDGTILWIRAHGTTVPADRPLVFVVFEDVTAEQTVAAALRQAEGDSAQRAAQQSAVAELGRCALTGPDPVDVAQRASELVCETLGVRFAGVLYDDGHPDGLLQVASSGDVPEVLGDLRRPSDEAWTEVLLRREPLLIPDVASPDSAPIVVDRDLLASSGLGSIVASPIVPNRVPPGALVAGADEIDAFSTQDTTFLEAMANVLASALDSHFAMDELRHHALHDALTGLPNRTLVLDHLEQALNQAPRAATQVAVLVCDLDRFKVVNDGLGHAAGDEVLRVVAHRLTEHVRPGDTVGRFGGDEFVIVCPQVDLTAVVTIAERLSAAFSEPMEVQGTQIVTTASMGIAFGAHNGPETATGLLRDADAAMYRAKAQGRARYELFDDEMRDRASHRLLVEADLRRAMAEDELVLHYQPVIDLRDGRLAGVEALVRWEHPDRGLLEPADFLDVADESGLLVELGHWVFEEAAGQTARWMHEPGWEPHWLAVNLGPRELTDPGLVRSVDASLVSSRVDPRLLRVELTEDSLLEDTVHVSSVLNALRRRGLTISVDDFGTGYSSLAYLKRLPLDALKLDRAFVDGLGERDSDDSVIASAIVEMAHALHLRVVAEGVETEEQLDMLRRLGCDLAQGYLIAFPMPPAELARWIAKREDA